MLFQIEFFRCTNEEPQGKTIRRNSGQFASERDAEIYGFTARPEGADGFRILKDGAVRKTVSGKAPKTSGEAFASTCPLHVRFTLRANI